MSFRIAIPTYKRAKMLSQKTLRVLAEQNIDSSLIDIFVADKEEEKIYKETLTPGTYDRIIVGFRGLSRQKSFIREFYPVGLHVFSIDDDIRGIATLNPNFDLTKFLEMMFDLCHEHDLTMWGVYPASSLMYMKNEIRKGVFYLVGCFYGFINTHDMPYPPFDDKEDWWASLYRAKTDGAVLRCNWVAPKTTYWLKDGGMWANGRTLEIEAAQAEVIVLTYPEYCKEVYIRKNGHPDIKLKKLPFTLV